MKYFEVILKSTLTDEEYYRYLDFLLNLDKCVLRTAKPLSALRVPDHNYYYVVECEIEPSSENSYVLDYLEKELPSASVMECNKSYAESHVEVPRLLREGCIKILSYGFINGGQK